MTRSQAITRIRNGLNRRTITGTYWSVSKANIKYPGWINITSRWKENLMSGVERAELSRLTGYDGPVHYTGLSVPPGDAARIEFVNRAEGS